MCVCVCVPSEWWSYLTLCSIIWKMVMKSMSFFSLMEVQWHSSLSWWTELELTYFIRRHLWWLAVNLFGSYVKICVWFMSSVRLCSWCWSFLRGAIPRGQSFKAIELKIDLLNHFEAYINFQDPHLIWAQLVKETSQAKLKLDRLALWYPTWHNFFIPLLMLLILWQLKTFGV